jgi:ParB family transcriptional regulator, chromosome partitioning protein
MRLKDLSHTTAEIYNLPLEYIAIEPGFNVRGDTAEVRAHLEMLRDSMLEQGFLRTKPLVVRLERNDTKATLVDGHCRYYAALMARDAGAAIVSIPCVSEGKGVSLADRTLTLLTSNNGLPLAPLEQAEAIKRLLSYGWSESAIGRKIGRTRQHVANLLELAAAPEGVKVMVVDGTVSATEAVKTIRAKGGEAAAFLEQARERAFQEGRKRVTGGVIRRLEKPQEPAQAPDPAPRRFEVAKVPLQTAAEHVVFMAKGHLIPDDLQRAIDVLADSLS